MAKEDKNAEAAPAAPATKYTVLHSGITDKNGELRRRDELVSSDELADQERLLSLEAIGLAE